MDSVIFAANDGVKGVELWRLDSATGTPVLVKDINPGAGHSQIGNITKCGDHAFFTAYDGQSFGLYRTDGTESGNVRLTKLAEVNNLEMVAAHGTLYFISPGLTTLFKSDEIGGATCKARECQYDSRSGVSGALQKDKKKKTKNTRIIKN